jgi:very-short-patch-repair endonuclease
LKLDGRSHALRRAADARRDEKLQRLGYRVLRLDAQLVTHDLPAAVARLRQVLEALGRGARGPPITKSGVEDGAVLTVKG